MSDSTATPLPLATMLRTASTDEVRSRTSGLNGVSFQA